MRPRTSALNNQLPLVLSTLLLLAALVAAAAVSRAPPKKPYITTVQDITTECKTCPRTLCPNVEWKPDENTREFNVTCWTRGTKIMGDNLWLKTDKNCYVTQYDLKEYEGNWDEDLAYCGPESEEEHLTLEDATLKYKTECSICLGRSCDVVAFLPEETDLTLTCWTDQGIPYHDNPYYYKTTNNCYVAEVGLYDRPNQAHLDYCGPVPGLQWEDHNNGNGTSEINKKRGAEARPAELSPHYLVDVKVGEEYSYCREHPDKVSKVMERYVFNQTVTMQCITIPNGTWYAQSTDFCYCDNLDFWDEPINNYRMPRCENFVDPDGKAKILEG